ncbi:hypothetical protein COCOBI_04-4890 [Coccomyxa sp. Obi]|nr:hypothetical protein COCOBI_04-4890 [Coccomyxa sp. Obi]
MEVGAIEVPKQSTSQQTVKAGDIEVEGRHSEQSAVPRDANDNVETDVAGSTPVDGAVEVAQDLPPKVTKQVLTADQKRVALKLRNELDRQLRVVQRIIEKQIQLTGQDPTSKNEAATKTVEKATASGAAIKADEDGPPKAVAGTSPAAKTSRLSPESEAVLLTLFGVQDMLGREEAQVLANQAGCSESQVREYFTKLRSNVRSFMQRLQRKATSAEVPAAGADFQTAPPQLQPSGGAVSAALSNTAPGQPVGVQSAAAQPAPAAAASSAATTGARPAEGPAPSAQMHAGAGMQPTSAGRPQASPMTAADLRNLLANVASAQVALQQSPAGASSAAPVKEEPVAAAVVGPSMDELVRADAAREAGLTELQRYLDAEGGIAAAKHAGPVASLMARAASAEVREALLHALLRTQSGQALAQLAGSGRVLDTLDSWARWAEIDKQSTLLRLLLRVLQRLPMPAALLRGSSLQKTVGRLQKYRSPGIAMAATAVLQHWYKLEQMSFPTGVTSMLPPPPPIRVAVQPQAARPDPAHIAAPQRLPSAHMPVFKPGSPHTAAMQAPQRNVPVSALQPACAPKAFQQSQGQAELLKPSQNFYRGIAGRLGSVDKSSQPHSPKVLSADEIVRAKAKERSRLASAAGLSGQSGPSKSSRLDASALLDFASRRTPARPGLPPILPPQARNSNATLPQRLQGSSSQQQQRSWQPQDQPQLQHQPRHMLYTAAHSQGQLSTMNRTMGQAQEPQQHVQPQQAVHALPQLPQRQQEAPVLRATVPWVSPQPMAQAPKPTATESAEAAAQCMRNKQQPETIYKAPELVPSSPAEPEEVGQDAGAREPTKVPILPTDPVERVQQLQVLQAAGVPSDAVLGLTLYPYH